MKLQKIFGRLASSQTIGAIAVMATILAYVTQSRIFMEVQVNNPLLKFVLRWGPDIVFYPCAILALAIAVSTIFRRRKVDVQHHRIAWISPTGGQTVYPEGASQISLESEREHFDATVSGRFYGPELPQLVAYVKAKHQPSEDGYVTTLFLLVAELRRSTGDLWWPQDPYLLKEDGTYEGKCYFGGTGIDSAQDGDLFGLRIFVPSNPRFRFPDSTTTIKLVNLPDTLYLSQPLYVVTHRPPGWSNLHEKALRESPRDASVRSS